MAAPPLAPAALDVEDFPWVNSAEMGVSPEKFASAFELAGRAARAFRVARFDEAISFYSKALLQKPGDAIILSNRSITFCNLSRLLRERPASASEDQPLNGLDPTTHAELALKDAEKVLTVRGDDPRSYLLKANALILLEQYSEAREALLGGLQINPLSNILQSCLQVLDASSTFSAETRHRKLERSDDFECTLCFKLLYEPVTTPCGHSFCRSCLHQSMDHGNKCPMCRTVLFLSPRTYPVSVTLKNIIQKNFPEEYAERKSENDAVIYSGIDLMPLFVMDVVLPCQKLSLNIFEPRYRLMVRRVMEGNHRMGMVGIDPATGNVADCACEVEILECEPLPDGRFYLEVEGRRRFSILRSWDQDGYRVAEVEWIQDARPAEGSNEKEELAEMVKGAMELAKTWMQGARESARTGRRSRRLDLLEAENVPGLDDPERFSFWLVTLLNLRLMERLELLRLQETRERISRALVLLRADEQGCRVQ